MTGAPAPGPAGQHSPAARTAAATLAALGSSPELGLRGSEAERRLARDGANEIPEQQDHPLLRFAHKFWGPSAWMIELIVALSLLLQKWTDFWLALALLLVNAILSFLQESRASDAVSKLRHRLQVTARVLRDGTWQALPARTLVAGDVVRVRAGDFVPADGQLIEGEVRVDQSALTGESQQIARSKDDTLYSGSTIGQGEATAVVVATGLKTFFGRTAQLVESARPKLHVEEVIARVVRWLFLLVGTLVAITLVSSIVEGLPILDVLPLALVLLMGAVPVALPVMFTVSMAVGSMELSRRGVLVTRLNAAEDAATMDMVCADKTGTLTLNRLSFSGAAAQQGFTDDDVVRDGALASTAANQDAIDLAFLRAGAERKLLDGSERPLSFVPFSPQNRRTEAVVELHGRRLRVMKGALHTIAEAADLGDEAVRALEDRANEAAKQGFRALAVARAEDDGPLRLVGLALLRDEPRPDSGRLIAELRSLGVGVKMLTGDALPVARQIAGELGIGKIVRATELRAAQQASASRQSELLEASSGFAEVFPDDKFLVVKSLQEAGHVTGMTGDGVNDAPALRQAEVGIAVSGATDVAKGAASVVLTTEGLAGIIELIRNGRAIYQRVLTWIVNKMSRTVFKTGFVVIMFLVTGQFVISALGMILLLFMTDFVKIALSTDRTRPSQRPETWEIGSLVVLAGILGLLMLAEALGFFAFAWYHFDLGADPGRMQTFTFQTLLFFALFSILSIRERRSFWASRPSAILAAALLADAGLGASIGVFGFADLQPLPFAQSALIFGVAMVCSLGLNDTVKARFLARYWR